MTVLSLKGHRAKFERVQLSYVVFTVPPNQPVGAQQCNSYIQLGLRQRQKKRSRWLTLVGRV